MDAETNEYVDMMRAGIIDPTKVERVALQHAASIASPYAKALFELATARNQTELVGRELGDLADRGGSAPAGMGPAPRDPQVLEGIGSP